MYLLSPCFQYLLSANLQTSIFSALFIVKNDWTIPPRVQTRGSDAHQHPIVIQQFIFQFLPTSNCIPTIHIPTHTYIQLYSNNSDSNSLQHKIAIQLFLFQFTPIYNCIPTIQIPKHSNIKLSPDNYFYSIVQYEIVLLQRLL